MDLRRSRAGLTGWLLSKTAVVLALVLALAAAVVAPVQATETASHSGAPGSTAATSSTSPSTAPDTAADGTNGQEGRIVPFPERPSTDEPVGSTSANVTPNGSSGDRQPVEANQLPPLPDPGEVSTFHLKLVEGHSDALVGGRLVDHPTVQGILDSADLTVERLFGGTAQELRDLKAAAEARSGSAQASLALWFRLTLEGPNQQAMAGVLDALNAHPGVEVAYPEPPIASANMPLSAPATEPGIANPSLDFTDAQIYLDPAPTGVGARAVWAIAGGRGDNVMVYDIEQAWNTAHEDLTNIVGAEVLNGIPLDPAPDDAHGTAVAGVLWGDDNDFGVTGVVPDAGAGLVNVFTTTGIRLTNAIMAAAGTLQPGDIALIEQQVCPGPLTGSSCEAGWLPVEYVSSYYDAIKTATDAGIIVVEAGGNGGRNVDEALTRADSGAILVGGGNAPGCRDFGDEPALARLSYSNYGERIHLQSHGGCVYTTGTLAGGDGLTTNTSYTSRFSGTSSAGAIVAGAAASVSSIALEHELSLTPVELRSLLMDTGTPQDRSGLEGNIGPQPDAWAAATLLLQDVSDPSPDNDDFFTPLAFDRFPITHQQGTNGATIQIGEPSNTCSVIGETVWFQLTAPTSGTVQISTAGSSFDTTVALWNEVSQSGLQFVGCNDNAGDDGNGEPDSTGLGGLVASGEQTSLLEVDLVAGESYRVQVGSPIGQRGDLVLSMVSVGTCDFNGDLLGDVPLGIPSEAIGSRLGSGAVGVLMGAEVNAPVRVPVLHQDTPNVPGVAESADRLGGSTTCADVTGDGIDDLIVGAPGEGLGPKFDAGVVFVFPSGTAAGSFWFSQNRPGIPGEAERGDEFGASLSHGDFNNDGWTDLVVGAPGEAIGVLDDAGALFVIWGSSRGLAPGQVIDVLIVHQDVPGMPGIPEVGDRFGETLATGDLNNDGFDDLVAGVPGEDLGAVLNAGMVTVMTGSATGVVPAANLVGTQGLPGALPDDLAAFGSALAVADLDGDGAAELAVGAPGAGIGTNATGRVHVFGVPQLSEELESSATLSQPAIGDLVLVRRDDVVLVGQGIADRLGQSLAAGDINGDGLSDLIVGVPGRVLAETAGAGAVDVHLSGAEGFGPNPIQVSLVSTGVVVAGVDDLLGWSVYTDDLDGDGFDDLVAGAPGHDVGSAFDAGLLLVMRGTATGLNPLTPRGISQNTPGFAGLLETGDRLGAIVGPSVYVPSPS